ncbi:hypothetical protein [Blautia obeum]|uniref:hypothetical protein n=1 Tax=Blautia obeum TaxID=40520 RepID=UPI00319DB2C2
MEKMYKELKGKQKGRISEKMFLSVCDYYRIHGEMPDGESLEQLAKEVCTKCQGIAGKVNLDSLNEVFLKKQSRFAERIAEHGLPEPPKPKVKKTEAEKLAIKRAIRKRKKKRKEAQKLQYHSNQHQNDQFFFIAGYTSGGAPYGVTWEEMGMEPWENPE